MADRAARPDRWHRLDNTANLFPVVTSRQSTNVFRLSVALCESVVPDLLLRALSEVLPDFPAFRVRLRRGVFWHYLEENPEEPLVREEDEEPCRYIDPDQNRQFLFRVTYFERRVNLETFHVLTDGTGALQFLQAITCRYLILAHPAAFTDEQRAQRWFSEHADETEDSYAAHYVPTKKTSFRIGQGTHLRGETRTLGALSVIHAHVQLPGLLALCRSKGVSISQYVTACIGYAVYTEVLHSRPPRHPINIFMPVNLRNLFESNTALNFFSNVYISLACDQPGLTFDEMLAEVKRQFEEKVTREAMLERISYTVSGGNNPFIRLVPLPLKNLVLRIIFEISAVSSTLGYSNLGRVVFPPPFDTYVAGMLLLLHPVPREPFKCASISYGDVFTLTFTSTLKKTNLQENIVRRLTGDGLQVILESNGVDHESL